MLSNCSDSSVVNIRLGIQFWERVGNDVPHTLAVGSSWRSVPKVSCPTLPRTSRTLNPTPSYNQISGGLTLRSQRGRRGSLLMLALEAHFFAYQRRQARPSMPRTQNRSEGVFCCLLTYHRPYLSFHCRSLLQTMEPPSDPPRLNKSIGYQRREGCSVAQLFPAANLCTR